MLMRGIMQPQNWIGGDSTFFSQAKKNQKFVEKTARLYLEMLFFSGTKHQLPMQDLHIQVNQ